MSTLNKDRVFFIDFVRALATCMIVLTHFNANFLGYNGPAHPEKSVLTSYPFGIYIGSLGVGLFFIISGWALQQNYGTIEQRGSYFSFIKTRMMKLLPIFWIGYLLAFCYYFLTHRDLPAHWYGVNKVQVVSTFFQVDSFVMSLGFKTFALIGEWFIGSLLVMYLLFPFMATLSLKLPKIQVVVVVLLFAGLLIGIVPDGVLSNFLDRVLAWLPLFLFGLYYRKFIKDIKFYVFLPALIILGVQWIVKPNLPEALVIAYVCIACFICLVYIGDKIDLIRETHMGYAIIQGVKVISKYSYAIFLTHHFIENQVVERWDLQTLSQARIYLLFFVMLPIIFACSVGLKKLDECARKVLKKPKAFDDRIE